MDPMVTPYDEIERLLKENAALRGEVAVLKAEMVKRDGEYRERTGEYIRACNEITELKAALSRYREAV